MGVIKTRRNDEPPVCLDTEALRTVTPVEHREQPSPLVRDLRLTSRQRSLSNACHILRVLESTRTARRVTTSLRRPLVGDCGDSPYFRILRGRVDLLSPARCGVGFPITTRSSPDV